jgi:putative transposase
MLDRFDRWNAYLSDTVKLDKEALIERHTRTGRPLGNPDFIRKLKIVTGEELAPKRPGRKSTASK